MQSQRGSLASAPFRPRVQSWLETMAARLVVLAAETGGRCSDETAHFLRGLANFKGKAETAPLPVQNRVRQRG